jgi:transcriptional regulator with XRE-family HTH domain
LRSWTVFREGDAAPSDGIVATMAVQRSLTRSSHLKAIRTRLHLSQAECAAALGVAAETLRTWDSGRRSPPAVVLERVEALGEKRPRQRLPLQRLAHELGVHVRTLRAAAHDGRLAATFHPRPYFGNLTATATREAGALFMTRWYRQTYGRGRRPLVAVCRVTVPANYAAKLVGLRRRLVELCKVGPARRLVIVEGAGWGR